MTKANRKFRTPPLFRLLHPRGSFRDFTYITKTRYSRLTKAEKAIKKRKRKEQRAKNLCFYRMMKPTRKAKRAATKMGIQIQRGFDIAEKWNNEQEIKEETDSI